MTARQTYGLGAFLVAALVALVVGVGLALPPVATIAMVLAMLIPLVGVLLEAPELALLALIVIRPIVDAYVYTSVAGFTLGEVWGLALILTTIVCLVSRRQTGIPVAPLAFLLVFAAMTLVRPSLYWAFNYTVILASWLLLIIAAQGICTSRRGQRAVLRTMWGTTAVLLVVIAVAMLQGRYGSAYYGITETSGYSRPHALAPMAVLLLPFVLVNILIGKKTLLPAVAAGLLALGIVASFVRTSWLALVAILVGFVVAALLVGTERARLAVVAIFGAVVFSGYLFWHTIAARLTELPIISTLVGANPYQGGGSGRVTFWGDLLRAGTDSVPHILWGRGAGASRDILSATYGAALWSHNDFLEFFITGGVILLVAYLALLGWMVFNFVALLRDRRQSRVVHCFAVLLIGTFAGYLILSFADGIAVFTGSVFMAMLVGLARGMMATPGETALDDLASGAESAAGETAGEREEEPGGPPDRPDGAASEPDAGRPARAAGPPAQPQDSRTA